MLAELIWFSKLPCFSLFIYDCEKIPIFYVFLKDGIVQFAFVLCLFCLTYLSNSVINSDLGWMNMSTKDNRIPLKYVLILIIMSMCTCTKFSLNNARRMSMRCMVWCCEDTPSGQWDHRLHLNAIRHVTMISGVTASTTSFQRKYVN